MQTRPTWWFVNVKPVGETNELTRLGSTESRAVTARVVVATNRDLLAEVKNGNFREDLYYRLNVVPVHVEPLRKRPEDTPALIAHYLRILSAREALYQLAAFLRPRRPDRLSQSSTFTPARFMMKYCCVTESRLFHVQ